MQVCFTVLYSENHSYDHVCKFGIFLRSQERLLKNVKKLTPHIWLVLGSLQNAFAFSRDVAGSS